MSMTYIYIYKVEQYLFTVYLCFFFFFLIFVFVTYYYYYYRHIFVEGFIVVVARCFPCRFVKFNKTFIRARGRDTRNPRTFECCTGVPAVWKCLKNVRAVDRRSGEALWSVEWKKRTELYLLLRAASFGMVGASVGRKGSIVVMGERWENRPFQCGQRSSYGRQPFPAWYRK